MASRGGARLGCADAHAIEAALVTVGSLQQAALQIPPW
jgi:hypothetical protein